MDGGWERRRSFRVAVPGVLLLWRNGRFSGDYSLGDVSLGGCGLRLGPPRDFGDNFDVALRIGGTRDIDLRARVVRRGLDGRTGLCFEDADGVVEDEIHDLLVASLESRGDRAGEVLLVHHRPELATHLITMLERLGHRVRIACTVLEAVWMLEQHSIGIHSALVSRVFGDEDGRDIVRFLSIRYPRIRRVLLDADANDEAHARDGDAHSVLSGLCDLSGLRRALPETARLREPAKIVASA